MVNCKLVLEFIEDEKSLPLKNSELVNVWFEIQEENTISIAVDRSKTSISQLKMNQYMFSNLGCPFIIIIDSGENRQRAIRKALRSEILNHLFFYKRVDKIIVALYKMHDFCLACFKMFGERS
jgi:hypothetical protein